MTHHLLNPVSEHKTGHNWCTGFILRKSPFACTPRSRGSGPAWGYGDCYFAMLNCSIQRGGPQSTGLPILTNSCKRPHIKNEHKLRVSNSKLWSTNASLTGCHWVWQMQEVNMCFHAVWANVVGERAFGLNSFWRVSKRIQGWSLSAMGCWAGWTQHRKWAVEGSPYIMKKIILNITQPFFCFFSLCALT